MPEHSCWGRAHIILFQAVLCWNQWSLYFLPCLKCPWTVLQMQNRPPRHPQPPVPHPLPTPPQLLPFHKSGGPHSTFCLHLQEPFKLSTCMCVCTWMHVYFNPLCYKFLSPFSVTWENLEKLEISSAVFPYTLIPLIHQARFLVVHVFSSQPIELLSLIYFLWHLFGSTCFKNVRRMHELSAMFIQFSTLQTLENSNYSARLNEADSEWSYVHKSQG